MDSWHPILVHFPLVLLPLGTAVDLLALWRRRPEWQGLAYGMLALGTLGIVAAVLSGNVAAATYRSDARVKAAIERHEGWATLVLLFFLCLSLSRLPLHLRGNLQGWQFKAWLAAALIGCALLWQTGFLGGGLVYGYGVGVHLNP